MKETQHKVDQWIQEHGVRYFNELTNFTLLTDILFVLCCLANQMDIDLDEAMERNILKKTKRDLHRHEQNEKLKK